MVSERNQSFVQVLSQSQKRIIRRIINYKAEKKKAEKKYKNTNKEIKTKQNKIKEKNSKKQSP